MVKNGYRTKKTQDSFLSLKEGDIVIVCDTETTGLSPSKGDRILEWSAEKIRVGTDYKLEVIDAIQVYINPQFPIPPKVSAIHGITDEFISDKPVENEVFDTIYKWMRNAIVCGHNISFDNRFIADMFERHGKTYEPILVLDTLQAARDLVDSKDVPNNELGTIAKLYGADEGITFHTAKDDVRVCSRVFQIFLDEYAQRAEIDKPKTAAVPRTAEEMLAHIKSRQAQLPKKIPYIKGMCLQIYHHANNNRLYFYTDCGSIWYDRYNKCWGYDPKKMKVPFEALDMEAFIRRAVWLAGVSEEAELTKIKLKEKETFWFNNGPYKPEKK